VKPHLASLRQSPRNVLSIPIAIKFAVFISVLVLVFMVWQTTTAMRVAVESQDAAINESGIKDVSALATTLEPAWITDPRLRDRLTSALKSYCAATRELGVLNAMVYPIGGGEALATGKADEASFKISELKEDVFFPRAQEAGVKIQELEYNRQPVRTFVKEIRVFMDGGEAPIGRVEVMLSAQRISQSRDAIRDRMVMVSAVAATVAAAVSFLLAAFLTYPIRTLAKDLRQVSLGRFEHQSRVRSGDEIGDLARTFNQMTSNLRHAQEAVVAQKAIEHELNLATRIQTRLLPASIPQVPGFDIAAHYHSAREVGGDYYDFVRIDTENLGIVVADVSGKGVPGSLVMTMTRSLLRMAAAGGSPFDTIDQVNRILAPDISPGMFVTLVYLVLHLPTHRVRLVRAGHNAPLLYSARQGKLIALQPRGIALGLDPRGALFRAELEVQQFTLRSGDFLVAYTDGIVEGKDPQGESYSDERFARRIQEETRGSAQSIINSVITDLDSHRKTAEQSDDITILCIKCTINPP
jgi:serine phosphatase RsbU (regulator of sigma subunit)